MNNDEMIVVRAFRGLDKQAKEGECPGAKIRSKGMGRGMGVGKGKGPIGRATAMKYGWKPTEAKTKTKKKAVITKESLAKNTNDAVVEVEVDRINKAAAMGAIEALEKMKGAPEARRPSGVTNADVSRVGALRSVFRAKKDKQDQIDAVGDTMDPQKQASVGLLDLMKSAQPATAGAGAQADPYAAFQQMATDGDTVSKAIPGISPDIVMQGQQQGVDMTPGAIKKRLGAHEMIAKGKQILKDDNQNGVPDVAEGAGGGGMGAESQGMQQPQGMAGAAPQEQSGLTAMAKLRMPDLTKQAIQIFDPIGNPGSNPPAITAGQLTELKRRLGLIADDVPTGSLISRSKGALGGVGKRLSGAKGALKRLVSGARGALSRHPLAAGLAGGAGLGALAIGSLGKKSSEGKQNTKSDDEGNEIKPGIEFLASACDTPPKNAPKKQPEEESENEAETTEESTEKKAAIGSALKNLLTKKIGTVPFKAFPLAGAAIGGVKGGFDEKDDRLEQIKNILSGALKGGAIGVGAGSGYHAGRLGKWAPHLLGAATGGVAANELLRNKSAADESMGSGTPALAGSSDLPVRDGFKSTNRQEVFNDLSKWSLGARA